MEFNVFMYWIIFATSLCCFLRPVAAVSSQTLQKGLYDYLKANYSTSLLPICETDGNVTVNMDLALRHILDLNEKEELITTSMWIRMRWNDCRLAWVPSDYNNLSSLTMGYVDIWVPDITLYDSATEVMFPGMSMYRPGISSSGTVNYNFPALITSTCQVNVRYFPFDSQRCPLKFGSWSYHGLQLDLHYRQPYGDLDQFNVNSEWIVDAIEVERNVFLYNCCPEPYPDVTYYLVIRRRPTFAALTMIFPCILTAFMAALGFVLPVESGEKVSLEMTVLLSLAVFLLLVSEALPPSSENFPIIGAYFATSMALVSLSLTQTVFVLNIYYRGENGRTMSRCTKRFFFGFVAKVLCVKISDENAVRPLKADSETDSDSEKESAFLYRDLANILDRMFLFFFVIASVVTTLTLLMKCVDQYGYQSA